jgi:hypothetical protein
MARILEKSERVMLRALSDLFANAGLKLTALALALLAYAAAHRPAAPTPPTPRCPDAQRTSSDAIRPAP